MAVGAPEHRAVIVRHPGALSMDLAKLAVWVAAVIVPWAAIMAAGYLVIAAAG